MLETPKTTSLIREYEVDERRLKMGNQLGKTDDNEIRLAWLAGLLDGEGSISLVEQTSGGYQGKLRGSRTITPRVSISNTNVPTLRRVEEILTANEIAFYVRWREPGRRYGFGTLSKPLWTVWVAGVKRSLRFLEIVLPYLVTKAPQAAVLYDWGKQVIERPRRIPDQSPNTYLEGDRAVKKVMNELNQNPQRLHAEHAIERDDIV